MRPCCGSPQEKSASTSGQSCIYRGLAYPGIPRTVWLFSSDPHFYRAEVARLLLIVKADSILSESVRRNSQSIIYLRHNSTRHITYILDNRVSLCTSPS